ncbi:MAG: LysR family transcriptional regulator [Ruminococcus sp.]|jgi:DNA-binding transcriptional LysR family regulator|nr:LysR family transcriptional regulator [Ruminococcus sp.]
MNILYLKYAVEIEKSGSLNKAAEHLYMGQPNLSRAIKELESALGITIFVRSAKGMSTTPEGNEFLQNAKKILSEIDSLENMYKSGKKTKQKFSISVPRACYISEAFSQFSKLIDPESPAELFYNETNSLHVIKNITENDYKLGIIRYPADYDKYFKEMLEEKGFAYELVTEFRYVLIMSKQHQLSEYDDISYDDLKPYTEIAHADPFLPSIPASAAKKEELPENIEKRIFVFERASQFDLLSENTDTFMWVSLAPQKLLDRFGLVKKKCSDNCRIYKDVLIYKKDYHLSELDKLFITELCKSKRQHI